MTLFVRIPQPDTRRCTFNARFVPLVALGLGAGCVFFETGVLSCGMRDQLDQHCGKGGNDVRDKSRTGCFPAPRDESVRRRWPLHYMSLQTAARRVASRNLSPIGLTQHMLDRISAVDPVLRSYATVTASEALADARNAARNRSGTVSRAASWHPDHG